MPRSPWDADDGFQLSGVRRIELPLIADGEKIAALADFSAGGLTATVDGQMPAGVAVADKDAIYVLHRGRQTRVTTRDVSLDRAGVGDATGLVRAPMHGKVLAVLVDKGARVARGQRVAIIEAMKMEHALTAPFDGTVAEVSVSPESQVDEGAAVLRIEAAQE
jgi:3-methylcrotonyl-CoA carboxylase alpha subunit